MDPREAARRAHQALQLREAVAPSRGGSAEVARQERNQATPIVRIEREVLAHFELERRDARSLGVTLRRKDEALLAGPRLIVSHVCKLALERRPECARPLLLAIEQHA